MTKKQAKKKGWLLEVAMKKRLKRDLEDAIIRMEMDPNLKNYLSRLSTVRRRKPNEPLSLERSKRKFKFEEEE